MSASAPGKSVFEQCNLDTVAVVLAGGEGTRLAALTSRECKPALPFGGNRKVIDFSLSNCVNSGVRRIAVATQYKPDSLMRHLEHVWRDPGAVNAPFSVSTWPAREGPLGSYAGTADAVYRNWDAIEASGARLVLILAGDHVYKMDYRPLLRHHLRHRADATVACVDVPIQEGRQFGIMSIGGATRVVAFAEKPEEPEPLPGRCDRTLASMGIYVFERELLGKVLRQDAPSNTSRHDFGADLIPALVESARVFAYPFRTADRIGRGYWRDVGTLPAYWRAHMELLGAAAPFDLDDSRWPIRRSDDPTLHMWTTSPSPECEVVDSLLASSSTVGCGARIRRSVLCAHAQVGARSEISDSVILPGARIGRACRLSGVIVDADCYVTDGTIVQSSGYGADRAKADPMLITANSVAHLAKPRPAVRAAAPSPEIALPGSP